MPSSELPLASSAGDQTHRLSWSGTTATMPPTTPLLQGRHAVGKFSGGVVGAAGQHQRVDAAGLAFGEDHIVCTVGVAAVAARAICWQLMRMAHW